MWGCPSALLRAQTQKFLTSFHFHAKSVLLYGAAHWRASAPTASEKDGTMTSETFESGSAAPEMAPVADKATAARNSLVINVLLVSTFVVMLNETAMSVAIPKLMEALAVD